MNPPKIVRLPNTVDIQIQQQWMKEQWLMYYPEYNLLRVDRTNTYVDPLYKETAQRRYMPAIKVRAYIDTNVSENQLTKWGLDSHRDVAITFLSSELADLEILENNKTFLIGDLIEYDGEYYEISDMVRAGESYWANTNIPFYITCTALRYRKGQ